MTIEEFQKIINDLCYSINFRISLDQEKLKLFFTYWNEYESKLTDKYKNLGKDILLYKEK